MMVSTKWITRIKQTDESGANKAYQDSVDSFRCTHHHYPIYLEFDNGVFCKTGIHLHTHLPPKIVTQSSTSAFAIRLDAACNFPSHLSSMYAQAVTSHLLAYVKALSCDRNGPVLPTIKREDTYLEVPN
jgi:hypothetical protein